MMMKEILFIKIWKILMKIKFFLNLLMILKLSIAILKINSLKSRKMKFNKFKKMIFILKMIVTMNLISK
jgi:hypothetical protein